MGESLYDYPGICVGSLEKLFVKKHAERGTSVIRICLPIAMVT